MIKAIIYHSNTGYTMAYAKLLSKELNLPCYSLEEAKTYVKKEDEVIYLSWICAGVITKLKKISRTYKVKCIGMVGAYPNTDKYLKELQKNNGLTIPSFYLQGGIDYSKLKGLKKLIVKAVGKTIPKENTELLNLFQNGGSYVKKENLEELIKYVKTGEIKNV